MAEDRTAPRDRETRLALPCRDWADTPPAVGRRFAVTVAIWLGSLGSLHLVSDLSTRPLVTIGLLLLALLAVGAMALSEDPRLDSRTWILGLALVGRLLMVPLSPDFSSDVWRYLWDGRVAAAGLDPYRLAPDDVSLKELRDRDGAELWRQLHHRSIPTVYPPLALAASAVCARLPGGLWWWKGLLTAVDLLACWLLLRLADGMGFSRRRILWYALHPLVLFEISGMGHVDALGTTAVVLSVSWLVLAPRRIVGSAVAAAAACLAKLVPVVVWPLWALRSRRPALYLLVAASVTGLALGPVLASGIPSGLVAYAVSWEFNGPVYEPLWRTLDAVGIPEFAGRVLDTAKERSGWYEAFDAIYPWLYARFLAKALLGVLAIGFCFRSLRDGASRRSLAGATGALFGGLLLCVATLYPWYLLWVLPWAALLRHRAWLWASGTVLLSYWPQFGEVELWPWVYLLVWTPPLVVALVDRRNGESPWSRA